MKRLAENIKQIQGLCDQHQVRALFAFGSVLNDDFNVDSDIDLVVDIASEDPLVYSDNYFELKSKLEQIFKRQIDLLEEKSIKNPFLKEQIEKTKVLLYGR